METKGLRTIIYGRVSTEDQVSTKLQIDEQLEEAKKNEEKIIDTIEEKRTAKDKEGIYDPIGYMKLRPLFYDLYLKAKKREFDILRVWKWDRFARSDFQEIIFRMFKDNGVIAWVLRDSNDNIVRSIQGIFSKAEIEKIKVRVEARHQEILEAKRAVSRPPLGYKFIGSKKKRHIVPDENKDVVIQIFELTAKGMHPQDICDKIVIRKRSKGRYKVIPLPKSTYKWVIKNRFYIGEYRFRNEVREVDYDTYISKELFNKCQK